VVKESIEFELSKERIESDAKRSLLLLSGAIILTLAQVLMCTLAGIVLICTTYSLVFSSKEFMGAIIGIFLASLCCVVAFSRGRELKDLVMSARRTLKLLYGEEKVL
jgi:uncharacterized membrane protein YgaE (UPF0421/DUF939 family)